MDGHERPETIAYMPIFTNKSLSFELRTHRWIQITKVDSKLLESNGDIAENCGFYYNTDDGVEMVVFEGDTGNTLFNGGNVGIGTDSPGAKLDIKKDDDTVYDPSADDGQRGVGATIQLNNNSNHL